MDKINVKASADWFLPWFAGAAFTVGYLSTMEPVIWADWSSLGRALFGGITFFIWPLLLGIALGGG